MLRAVLSWIGGRAIVYLLLLAALVLASVLLPWAREEWVRPEQRRARVVELEQVRADIDREAAAAQARFDRTVAEARGAGQEQLRARRDAAERRKRTLEAARPGRLDQLAWIATADADALIADRRRELEIAVLAREIAAIAAAERAASADAALPTFAPLRDRAIAADRTRAACVAAAGALDRFDAQWVGKRLIDRDRRARLLDARNRVCRDAWNRRSAVEREIAAYRAAREAQQRARDALDATTGTIAPQVAILTADLDRHLAQERRALADSLRERARGWAAQHDLGGKAWIAGGLLLAIILTPLAIRTLFYWVLAPIVARRPAIRLLPGGGASIPPAAPSSTSVGIRFGADEELLVRQDFLQSTALGGSKATQWLLDWRHPFSSIASGLWFLTRLRGAGQPTTVSAVRDPFAEVAEMILPDGAACVLQPRALVAVVEPIGRPMRVTSHWRLLSLHAWLTLQLRYLVFHGPARIVLRGGRGVRVEPGERGRLFGQDQLIGFSADLAYSVARTETFAPYLFGREPLFKDVVVDAHGVLIVEEAPLAGKRGGGIRRGLEGAADALLKIVGL